MGMKRRRGSIADCGVKRREAALFADLGPDFFLGLSTTGNEECLEPGLHVLFVDLLRAFCCIVDVLDVGYDKRLGLLLIVKELDVEGVFRGNVAIVAELVICGNVRPTKTEIAEAEFFPVVRSLSGCVTEIGIWLLLETEQLSCLLHTPHILRNNVKIFTHQRKKGEKKSS